MTPDAAKAMYLRQIEAHGETVSLMRGSTSYSVRARVIGAKPQDGVVAAQQLERKAIVLADDVASIAFPLPFRPKQDRLVWAGRNMVINAVDDATRRVAGVVIAYELTLIGG